MALDNISWFFHFILMLFNSTPAHYVEKGIMTELPKKSLETKPLEKNIIRISIDDKNKIFINKKEIALENLKDTIVKFIDGADKNPSNQQCKGIVYLKGDRNTVYENYIKVFNQIKEGYKIVRARELGWTVEKITAFQASDKSALRKDKEDYKSIVFLYPVVISEADTTDE